MIKMVDRLKKNQHPMGVKKGWKKSSGNRTRTQS